MAAGGTSVFARIAPENRQRLGATLPVAHGPVLRGMLNGGLMKLAVTPDIAGDMAAAGYVREGLGGLMLTDAGQLRAQMESA